MEYKNLTQKRIDISSVIAAILVVITIGSLIITKILSSPDIFKLGFNVFGLVSAVITFLSIIIVVLILKTKSHTDDIQWFLLYLVALVFFGTCQTLQSFSVYAEGAVFWEHLAGVAIVIMPAALFLFVKYYTRGINNVAIWITSLLAICWGIFSFFYATAMVIPLSAGTKLPWGYYNLATPQPGYSIILLWFGVLTLLSLTLLVNFYRKSGNPILKKQALIYILSVSLPAIVALMIDGILPTFNIGNSIPPLGLILTTTSAFLIFYGITRYHLFRLNPQFLAENILNTMEEGIIVTSYDLRIESINPQIEKMLGKRRIDLKDKYIGDYFPHDSWTKIDDNIKGRSNDLESGGLYINNQGGKPIPVRISISSLEDATKVLGYVFAISDITELQESYDALEKEKETITYKVDARTKELREAQERLAETDKIKTEFVTLTSHNLRTPLTIIQGNLDLLLGSKLDDNQKKLLSNLTAGTKRLDSLVEELLTISSIEAGDRSILEVTSLKDILQPIVKVAERLAVASSNSFSYEGTDQTALLKVNTTRLQAAITNLLDNAFKFTNAGTVKLVTSVDEQFVKIIIVDTGIGISEDEIPKLFTKFHRSSGEDRYNYDYEGKGLGLYFVKLIVAEHVGNIDVKSRLGQGTTITVTLPRYIDKSIK